VTLVASGGCPSSVVAFGLPADHSVPRGGRVSDVLEDILGEGTIPDGKPSHAVSRGPGHAQSRSPDFGGCAPSGTRTPNPLISEPCLWLLVDVARDLLLRPTGGVRGSGYLWSFALVLCP
jgi:hypothetical protein